MRESKLDMSSRLIYALEGENVVTAKVSPNGEWLAAIKENSTRSYAAIYPMVGDYQVQHVRGTVVVSGWYCCKHLAWSTDSNLLAVANKTDVVIHNGGKIVWGSSDRRMNSDYPAKKPAYPKFDGDINQIEWSPDGKWLAIACARNVVLHNYHENYATQLGVQTWNVMWSPDSKCLVGTAGVVYAEIVMWNIESGSRRGLVEIGDRHNVVKFSPDLKTVAALCRYDVRLTDFRNRKIYHVKPMLEKPTLANRYMVDKPRPINMEWSPDSMVVACLFENKQLAIYDMRDHSTIRITADDNICYLGWHPNQNVLISINCDNNLAMWLVAKWSDKNNYLFKPRSGIRQSVFNLMCVANRLQTMQDAECEPFKGFDEEDEDNTGVRRPVPALPMGIWLMIMSLAFGNSE